MLAPAAGEAALSLNQQQLTRTARPSPLFPFVRVQVVVGRMFFGNDAGQTWDQDCRPSDGVLVAMRCGCPFYVVRALPSREGAGTPKCHARLHAPLWLPLCAASQGRPPRPSNQPPPRQAKRVWDYASVPLCQSKVRCRL